MSESREVIEAPVRAALEVGDHGRAATLALELYGDEVMGFLVARMRSPSDASEAFAIFAEQLWRGLPAFQWRSSLPGWIYMVARNAAARWLRSPHNRAERNLTMSRHAELSALVERLRSATQAHLRTEVKDRMRELREKLPEDDQTLLILRVDRDLSWRELALVMHDGERPLPEAELDRAVARMRKRFERVKSRLRELAREDGLL